MYSHISKHESAKVCVVPVASLSARINWLIYTVPGRLDNEYIRLSSPCGTAVRWLGLRLSSPWVLVRILVFTTCWSFSFTSWLVCVCFVSSSSFVLLLFLFKVVFVQNEHNGTHVHISTCPKIASLQTSFLSHTGKIANVAKFCNPNVINGFRSVRPILATSFLVYYINQCKTARSLLLQLWA